jgi:hypothetical protein
MIKDPKSFAKQLMASKKFRVDFLIQEQLKYMKELEMELTAKSLESTKSNKLQLTQPDPWTQDSNKEWDFFDYEKNLEYVKTKTGVLNAGNELFELYQANLIRFQVFLFYFSVNLNFMKKLDLECFITKKVIKKLKTELDLARINLYRAMKSQKNLDAIRTRVAWLENEIERILLTNQNVC